MSDVVDKLPSLLETLFKTEIMRQWERATPMDASEFRWNIISNIHYNLSPEDFNRYKIGIADVLADIEIKLLEEYLYGDKIFRCISESELPIKHPLIDKRLRDMNYCIKLVEKIPNVSEYILDKIVGFSHHDIISNVLEIVKKYNIKSDILNLENSYINRYDETTNVERLIDFIPEVYPENEEISESLNKLLELSETNIEKPLESMIDDEILRCLNAVGESKQSITNSLFAIELDVITELQELIDLDEDVRNILGTGQKFYGLAHVITRFIEIEVLSHVVEQMREKRKHIDVMNMIASFVQLYVKDRWM